mgnify:CR=1 FL=1
MKLEVVVKEEDLDRCIETITNAARTGKIGDGKIFVSKIEKTIRIRTEEEDEDEDEQEQDEDDEPPVSLAHRALPLIELLRAAAKARHNVMWDSEHHLGS